MAATRDAPAARRTGSVQSIERAFKLLELVADHDGMMSVSQLGAEADLPLPTIHRLVRTLVGLGYLRQEASRKYVLAPRLIRLGESSAQMLYIWARPHLRNLVEELGESANLAMLDGDQIVYVAQAPSRHSMRMFTEVGRRVPPHCTAVGKALMADMAEADVRALLERTGMPQHTPNTITDPDRFAKALSQIAEKGYAVDEGEQEIGVRCVAVAIPNAPARLALSISGPATRMTFDLVQRAIPALQQAGISLGTELR